MFSVVKRTPQLACDPLPQNTTTTTKLKQNKSRTTPIHSRFPPPSIWPPTSITPINKNPSHKPHYLQWTHQNSTTINARPVLAKITCLNSQKSPVLPFFARFRAFHLTWRTFQTIWRIAARPKKAVFPPQPNYCAPKTPTFLQQNH